METSNKSMGILMAVLMTFSIFASAGFAVAQDDGIKTSSYDYTGSQAGFAKAMRAERRDFGVSNSVDAVRVFPRDAGVLDASSVNELIESFDKALSDDERKVGFFKGTFGKGYYTSEENDHLGFIQGLWISNSVTTSDELSDSVYRSTGKVRIEGKVYRLSQKTFGDDVVSFVLLGEDGNGEKGTISLERIASYDNGVRKIWNGKIDLGDIKGEVEMVTVTKSVRKASEKELRRAEQRMNEEPGTDMPNPEEGFSGEGNGPGTPVSVETNDRNIFRKVFDYFRRGRA